MGVLAVVLTLPSVLVWRFTYQGISGVVSSQHGEGTEDHRVLVVHVTPSMAIGNHVSLRSLCSLLYPVCVSELCGSGWKPGQLLRACLPQSRENSLSVEGTTNQCSWPCSSCGQATFDLDIGWESWNVVEALCSRAGMFVHLLSWQ